MNATIASLKFNSELHEELNKQLAALADSQDTTAELLMSEYCAVKANMKQIESILDILKERIKKLLGNNTVMEAGDYCATCTPETKMLLSREKLTAEMGINFVKPFMVPSYSRPLKVFKKTVVAP